MRRVSVSVRRDSRRGRRRSRLPRRTRRRSQRDSRTRRSRLRSLPRTSRARIPARSRPEPAIPATSDAGRSGRRSPCCSKRERENGVFAGSLSRQTTVVVGPPARIPNAFPRSPQVNRARATRTRCSAHAFRSAMSSTNGAFARDWTTTVAFVGWKQASQHPART
jgi:hypothetical protein